MRSPETISESPQIDESASEVKPEVKSLSRRDFTAQLNLRMKNLFCPVGEAYLKSPQKRGLDILGSIILFPFTTPFIAGAAAAIKLEDRGQVFYFAHVVGKGKEKFGMFKLRSMKESQGRNNGRSANSSWTKLNDQRITNVGKFIRQWSIDELPQLVNILHGEMSLIGNRPMFQERIEHLSSVPQLRDLYPTWIQTYKIAKPGAAGLAVSRGRHSLDETVHGHRNRMRYDIFYITHASLGFDLKLIIDTTEAALSRRGSY